MVKKPPEFIQTIRTELQQYPDPVLQNFDSSLGSMLSILSDAQLEEWGTKGILIAGHTVRSWEAAAGFYLVSPTVLGYMPHSYFIKWMDCGSKLCEESPTLATAYFEASPGAMSKLRSRHIEGWSDLGVKLYKGTWKSSTLACNFFTHSSVLLDQLSFQELEKFVAFLDLLSHRSYDLSSDCLVLGEKIFPFYIKSLSVSPFRYHPIS